MAASSPSEKQYFGVDYDKESKKWKACIQGTHIGFFEERLEAAMAYDDNVRGMKLDLELNFTGNSKNKTVLETPQVNIHQDNSVDKKAQAYSRVIIEKNVNVIHESDKAGNPDRNRLTLNRNSDNSDYCQPLATENLKRTLAIMMNEDEFRNEQPTTTGPTKMGCNNYGHPNTSASTSDNDENSSFRDRQIHETLGTSSSLTNPKLMIEPCDSSWDAPSHFKIQHSKFGVGNSPNLRAQNIEPPSQESEESETSMIDIFADPTTTHTRALTKTSDSLIISAAPTTTTTMRQLGPSNNANQRFINVHHSASREPVHFCKEQQCSTIEGTLTKKEKAPLKPPAFMEQLPTSINNQILQVKEIQNPQTLVDVFVKAPFLPMSPTPGDNTKSPRNKSEDNLQKKEDGDENDILISSSISESRTLPPSPPPGLSILTQLKLLNVVRDLIRENNNSIGAVKLGVIKQRLVGTDKAIASEVFSIGSSEVKRATMSAIHDVVIEMIKPEQAIKKSALKKSGNNNRSFRLHKRRVLRPETPKGVTKSSLISLARRGGVIAAAWEPKQAKDPAVAAPSPPPPPQRLVFNSAQPPKLVPEPVEEINNPKQQQQELLAPTLPKKLPNARGQNRRRGRPRKDALVVAQTNPSENVTPIALLKVKKEMVENTTTTKPVGGVVVGASTSSLNISREEYQQIPKELSMLEPHIQDRIMEIFWVRFNPHFNTWWPGIVYHGRDAAEDVKASYMKSVSTKHLIYYYGSGDFGIVDFRHVRPFTDGTQPTDSAVTVAGGKKGKKPRTMSSKMEIAHKKGVRAAIKELKIKNKWDRVEWLMASSDSDSDSGLSSSSSSSNDDDEEY